MKLTPDEVAEIRDLHKQGYNDFDIAGVLDRSERTIYQYRKKLGLPALPQSCRKQVSKLYDCGLLDKEIAERLSHLRPITSAQVTHIRRSLGKQVIKRSMCGSKRIKKDPGFERYRCRQLMSDEKIAKLYGGQSYAA